MPIEIWIAFVLTVLALMSTPGPSQLLMLTNSMRHGFPRSLATAAGDLSANMLQMLAAGLGLTVIIQSSEFAFSIIKWGGVAYLIWMGINLIAKARTETVGDGNHVPISLRALWIQGFITSAANPKAVVFFAALFPQFINPQLAFWPQFFALSISYIAIDGAFLTGYGMGAQWIAARLKGPARAWIDRMGGAFIIGAALLLALKSVNTN